MTDGYDIRHADAINADMIAAAKALDVQPIPRAAVDAAVKLRDTIRARPNQRHVRVETTVDRNGNFVHTLVVSVDPSSGVAVLLSEIDGYPVRIDPWPTR